MGRGLSSLSPVSPSFLHACRKDSPVKGMAERVHLSLSPPFWLSTADSLPCEHRPRFVLPSPPRSPAKRESPSRHHHHQRWPQDTNRTWHPERGWRWRSKRRRRRKMYSLLSSYPTALSLSVFSLGRPTAAEWWGRDAHWQSLWHPMTHGEDIWRALWPQFCDFM